MAGAESAFRDPLASAGVSGHSVGSTVNAVPEWWDIGQQVCYIFMKNQGNVCSILCPRFRDLAPCALHVSWL